MRIIPSKRDLMFVYSLLTNDNSYNDSLFPKLIKEFYIKGETDCSRYMRGNAFGHYITTAVIKFSRNGNIVIFVDTNSHITLHFKGGDGTLLNTVMLGPSGLWFSMKQIRIMVNAAKEFNRFTINGWKYFYKKIKRIDKPTKDDIDKALFIARMK